MPSTFPLAVATMGLSLCPAAWHAACERHSTLMMAAQELALNFPRLFGCPAENIDSQALFRIARVLCRMDLSAFM
jgi:hypothetical protein